MPERKEAKRQTTVSTAMISLNGPTTIEDIICKTALGGVVYERRGDEPTTQPPAMLDIIERVTKGVERHTRAVARLAPNHPLSEPQWDRLAIAIGKHVRKEIAPDDLRAMQWKDYIRLLEIAADEADADAQRIVNGLRQTLPSDIVAQVFELSKTANASRQAADPLVRLSQIKPFTGVETRQLERWYKNGIIPPPDVGGNKKGVIRFWYYSRLRDALKSKCPRMPEVMPLWDQMS